MHRYNIQTNHRCNHLPMGFYRPPQEYKYLNYNSRPDGVLIDTVVIHYTVSDYARSYYLLGHADGGRPGPSVHYMINTDGRIDNLVDDSSVAWHAGKSSWQGRESINKFSIGIELINPGSGEHNCYPVANEIKPDDHTQCIKHPFPNAQMDALLELLKCLKEEHPHIEDKNILGHMDVAPNRKLDPGVEFPWKLLYEHGHGIYSDQVLTNSQILLKFGDQSSSVSELKNNLKQLGYGYIEESETFDESLAFVVRAFHMHFNQDIEVQDAGWGDWNQIDQARLLDLLRIYNSSVTNEEL